VNCSREQPIYDGVSHAEDGVGFDELSILRADPASHICTAVANKCPQRTQVQQVVFNESPHFFNS